MTQATASMSPVPRTTFTSRRGLWFAALAVLSVTITSTAGRIISAKPVAGWYKTLVKPSFNPPNWAFPVAWSLLFGLMAIAFWRVLRLQPSERRRLAIALFCAQLCLNTGWSLAFFGANSPIAGLVVIVPFLLLIVATAWTFSTLDRLAGWLFVPYIGWVAFATLLNAAIVRLN